MVDQKNESLKPTPTTPGTGPAPRITTEPAPEPEDDPDFVPAPPLYTKGKGAGRLGDDPTYQRRHDAANQQEADILRAEENDKAMKRVPETGARASIEELEEVKVEGMARGEAVVAEKFPGLETDAEPSAEEVAKKDAEKDADPTNKKP